MRRIEMQWQLKPDGFIRYVSSKNEKSKSRINESYPPKFALKIPVVDDVLTARQKPSFCEYNPTKSTSKSMSFTRVISPSIKFYGVG